MRIVVGKGYIENNYFHFGNEVISIYNDDDFSSLLMSVSSRLVDSILKNLDPLSIILENINDTQVKVKHEGIASEDFIKSYLEYFSKRTENSYRRIMGYLTLLCESVKLSEVEASEGVIIARFLLNSWRSGLRSEEECYQHEKSISRFMTERTTESIINGERPPSILTAKNQSITNIIFDIEKTLEEILLKSENDVIINNNAIHTAILDHWIQYKLLPSELQNDLKIRAEKESCCFSWTDNENKKYRVNNQANIISLRKVSPVPSLMGWFDLC